MSLTLESHIPPTAYLDGLRADVGAGLTAAPKRLSPKWFYDQRGSQLFAAITRLPEYYLTRAEAEVLGAHAGQVATSTRAETLVELGAGSAEKTRALLRALRRAGSLSRFVPVDVDPGVLVTAGSGLASEMPDLEVRAVVADLEKLPALPTTGRQLVAFLGSTIGNLEPEPRLALLAGLRARTRPGDALLVGTDLVKDEDRLLAAYDDSAGVTAEFNRNVLRVINRALGADFEPAAFDHVARWDPVAEWMEMRLRSTADQVVEVPALGLRVRFGQGEEMLTEISAKFHRERLEAELARSGFRMARWWTDRAGDFGVLLAVPR